jgi:hypothetical protein
MSGKQKLRRDSLKTLYGYPLGDIYWRQDENQTVSGRCTGGVNPRTALEWRRVRGAGQGAGQVTLTLKHRPDASPLAISSGTADGK